MLHPNASLTCREVFGVAQQLGDVGVELEIEGVHLPSTITGWTPKAENSLRGEAIEYVTSRAVNLEQLQRRMSVLHKHLTSDNVRVNLSKRASTHIHVNLQQDTFKTFFGFILLFTLVEPLLLRLCGPMRNGNLFCIPSYETGELPSAVRRMVQVMSYSRERGFYDWPNQRGKYAALNIDAITTFGSAEVRCFPNTISPDDVMKWAGWLLNIRQTVRDWPDETFRSLLDWATTSPFAMARSIFTNEANLVSQCHPNTVAELLSFGREGAYEIFRELRPFLSYVEKEKKKRKKSEEIFQEVVEADFGGPTWASVTVVRR